MKTSLAATLCFTALLAGCGGNYQISRAGNDASTQADFERDERACNQANFFVPESSKNKADQTIHMSAAFIDCMRDKGWNFKRTERKLSWVKSVQLD
jgi:hypothetical protein